MTKENSRRDYFLLLLIFLLALFLRVIYLPQIAKEPPISDEAGYDEAAMNLISGQGYGMFGYKSYQPPLYPFFLAGIYRLFGHNYIMVKVIQMILGSFGCILLYSIAKIVFNGRIGLVSAFIYALYDGFIFLNGHLLTENLFVLLILFFVLFLLRFSKTENLFLLMFSGVLIGLAALTKTNVLVSVPFLCIWFWTRSKKWVLHSSVLILFIGMTISPWTIRNYLILRHFVPIATYTGESLFRFNYPNGMEVELDRERVRFKELGLKEGEMNSYYCKRLIEYVRNNSKGYFCDFFAWKVDWNVKSFFFSDYIWFPCSKPGVNIPYIPLISWRVLSFFSFMGILLSFRCWKRLSLFYFYLFPQIILILTLFFAWTRFRLPLEPFFIIFAAVSIYSVFNLEFLESFHRREVVLES